METAHEYSGLPLGTIERLIKSNVLPHRRTMPFAADHFTSNKVGRKKGVIIIERRDLDAYLDSLPRMAGNFSVDAGAQAKKTGTGQ
jgi:hypothetical protein